MRTTEHYELNLVEGTDKMNPLVQDVPNYEKIDGQMFKNAVASIGLATELKTGTVHNLTRENDSVPMIRFTATSRYNSGDTFTVDGVQVTALMVDGSTLEDGCYIIGSVVICSLVGSVLTFYGLKTKASDADRLGGELPEYYASATDLQNVNQTATSAAELGSDNSTSIQNLKTKVDEDRIGFFDANTIIKATSRVTAKETYTATENCYIRFVATSYGSTGGIMTVNGVTVASLVGNAGTGVSLRGDFLVPVKKGDVVTIEGSNSFASEYTVYGMR